MKGLDVSAPTTAELTQLTAPNERVEAADGITYAYRRFGNAERGAPPALFLMHFRGNLDNWDPALVDAIARRREVILFDNVGVGGSSGTTPRTFTAMAHDALAFVDALGLETLDVFGYSIGGYVAQEIALIRPRLVRRLVVAGTAPEGGEQLHGWPPEIHAMAAADEQGAEHLLYLFFERSPESVARGGSSSSASSPGRTTATRRSACARATRSSTRTPPGASRTSASPTGSPGSRSPPWWPTATTTSWCQRATATCWRRGFPTRAC